MLTYYSSTSTGQKYSTEYIKVCWGDSQVIALNMQTLQHLLFIDQFLIGTEVVGIYGTFRFSS